MSLATKDIVKMFKIVSMFSSTINQKILSCFSIQTQGHFISMYDKIHYKLKKKKITRKKKKKKPTGLVISKAGHVG